MPPVLTTETYVQGLQDTSNPGVLQVEATKGALWDAYAETAIYMEITQVQVSRSALAQGAKWSTA